MTCKKCKKQIEDDSIYCRFCGKKQIAEESPRKKNRRAHGTGSVVKLSGNRKKPYEARISKGGEQISIGTFSTRKEALVAIENASLNGVSDIHNATFEDIYNMLRDQKENKVGSSGKEGYSASYNYLKHLAKEKMRNIRTIHFQEAIDNAFAQGKGFSTMRKIKSLGSMMCEIALAHDLLSKNYADLADIPISEPKSKKPSFTAEQLKYLWELSDTDDTAAVIVALCYNGLRINEFFDLKKEYVDLDRRIIFVPGSKTDAGTDRIIVIPQDVFHIYHKLMDTPGEYLCASPKGKRYNSTNFRNRKFYPFLDEHGLNPTQDITPHSCRHTFAWLCVTSQLNLMATKDMIGHSKFSTTADIYATATAKDIEFLIQEADKLRRR